MNLFRRFPASAGDPARAGAHRLLDRAMAGEDIPAKDISEALRLTGDLAGELPTTQRTREARPS